MGEVKKPHALVVVFPAQGHIGPIMELCIQLASTPQHGFRITLANIGRNHHAALRRLEPVLHSQPALADLHLLEIPNGPDISTSGTYASWEICASLRHLGQQQAFVDIIRGSLRSQHPITCILSDFYTPFTLALARAFDLPRIVFCPQSAGTVASYMSLIHRNPLPTPGEVVDYIPGVTTLKWSEVSTSIQSADPNIPSFQFISECLHTVEDVPYILMNTFRELEEDSLSCIEERLKTKVFDIGPLLPQWYFDEVGENGEHGTDQKMVASVRKEDYSCLQWLDEQKIKSVLFVSFGSITILSSDQFNEFALGLEMSRTPILWVVRPDLMLEKKPVTFPDGYLERMRDRLCIVPWAPQKQVLIHRAVGGFLTHCGWNSTLESISAGVPILGWPYFADQMLNCRQCVDKWQVGLEMEMDESRFVTSEEVCEKVKMLMHPSHVLVRENVQMWKGRAHQAIRQGGSSDVRRKEFVRYFAESSPKGDC